jgi:transaldolase / glucose-6-phosphate isomerase
MRGADDLVSMWPALEIADKRSRLRDSLRLFPAPLAGATDADTRTAQAAAEALWRRDASGWSSDPAAQQKIANRLGWLSAPAQMADEIERLHEFAAGVKRDGFAHVVLLGMGGSSLAPEVLRAILHVSPGYPQLHMLDSTDPAAIRAAETPPERTLYLLASKSGTTIEPNTLAAYFRRRLESAGLQWTNHFVAVTDEGTELAGRARTERFRELFINPSDIGGRYSAISYFGLVPAALMGQNLEGLIGWSMAMLAAAEPGSSPTANNPAVSLGLAIGSAARGGRDKLTLLLPNALEPFGLWVEQLLAESTGKQGSGIVPIAGEAPSPAREYGDDRFFVRLTSPGTAHDEHHVLVNDLRAAGVPVVEIELPELSALGAEFVRWEIATAVAGAMLDVNPFDEPNVQQAKDATRTLLDQQKGTGQLPIGPPDGTLSDGVTLALTEASREALGSSGPESILTLLARDDYFALLAYLGPDPELAAELQELRNAVSRRTRAATMFGYGPRYLHSTGQLHKGGPNSGVFVLLTAAPDEDLPIPGESFTFATLELAQALGDFASLDTTGRRALHVHLPRPDRGLVRQVSRAMLAWLPPSPGQTEA